MDYIKVGQIVSTFGIRGEVKLYPLTSNVERFMKKNIFYVGEDHIAVNIAKSRVDKNLIILKFEEYNDINEILCFKGKYLYVSENDLYELPDNEYYIHDLIGLKVTFDNKEIGKLVYVIENASNDIYEIELLDGKKIYVPAVKNFISKISIEENYLEMNNLEGILNEV